MYRIATMSVALVMLAACGGNDSPSQGAPDTAAETAAPPAGAAVPRAALVDGCTLLTEEEVRSILGAAVGGNKPDVSSFDVACDWSSTKSGEPPRELSIEVGQLSASSVKREYDGFKKNMAVREDVTGIGEEAFLAGYGGPGAALVIRSDTLLVFINTTVPKQEDALRELGPRVLERLAPMRAQR